MFWELIWNHNPPLTVIFFSFTVILSVLVAIEPEMESKLMLLRGTELEVWRYITNIFYSGQLSLKFWIKLVLQ